MTTLPSAQDVADALAMTVEREDVTGAPWCPPGDGAALRRWVTDRSASLGTGIRRLVRLTRLMAVADGRDYVRFLYQRLGSLRGRHFRQAFERAAAEGHLPKSFAILSDSGIHLREAALAPQGAAQDMFEIDFAQMPRLAALLDFLHNALGFTVLADLLAPLAGPGALRSSADDVARAVQAALNAWLSDRLESQNHLLQAQQIRSFLASRGRVAPEAVDDEAILLFWTAAGEADGERMDGFRLYRSAAASMLRYRQALRDAAVARHLDDVLGGRFEPANDDIAADQMGDRIEDWRSPLRQLALPPASRVKWLTGKEQRALLNYLGGVADEAVPPSADGDAQVDAWRGGLAGDERFDLSFWLTLLRVDVFGAIQASIVARLRKRAEPNASLTQAMEQIDDASYLPSVATYTAVRDQLYIESLVALALLMEVGAAEAVILLNHLGGEEVVKAVLGAGARRRSPGGEEDEDTVDSLRQAIAPALQAAISDPATVAEGVGRKLLVEAIAARRTVSRAGFRREDRADPEIVAALRAGAAAVFQVVRELDRLTSVLSQKAATADFAGDMIRFEAAFRQIYLRRTDE